MGTRICHADADSSADADTNRIRTEANMSPSPLVGGHNILGKDKQEEADALSHDITSHVQQLYKFSKSLNVEVS